MVIGEDGKKFGEKREISKDADASYEKLGNTIIPLL
jgi:hypothetical protein